MQGFDPPSLWPPLLKVILDNHINTGAASALDKRSITNAAHQLELEMKLADLAKQREKVGEGEDKTDESDNVEGGEADDGGPDVEK